EKKHRQHNLHIPVRINYLSCRICRNLLRNPATIPCGHNFCIGCIEGHWDEGQRDLSCPECGKIFPSRPNLIRNTTLTDVLRDTERSMSRKRKSQESAESLRDQSTADTLGNGLCWLHKISQDNYCITDEKIICALCASDKHNGHIIGLVKEERRRKQVQDMKTKDLILSMSLLKCSLKLFCSLKVSGKYFYNQRDCYCKLTAI
uniref:RING-type domain-containing protein n=1 Tax=Cyprinodon variegatus TaxID=28743 RepID=A0A3Q2CCW7_CYPVA